MASKVISTILNLKDNFSKTLENTTKNTKGFQNQIQHTQNTINGFRDKAIGAFKGIAAGAGISLGGGFTAGVVAGNDLNNTLIKMKNTTGFTGKAMANMRDSMLAIYKDGYGENFNEIADTIKTIGQQGTYSSGKLKEMAEDALLIKDNFGFEVNESFRAAKMLMDQFGVSGNTAYSLIAQGAQYGLDKNGDLLDSINEYSVHFKQIGFSSTEMFNMLNNGAKSGTFSVDKLGDAIKEFGIRTKDGSSGTMTAFQQLGLDANSISAKFAKGGAEGKKAFMDVTNALNNMKDPLQQNQIGVALFGTMWEDLGKDGIKALTDTSGELDSTDEALKKIKANDMQSLTMSFKKIKNSIVTDVLLPLGTSLQPTVDKVVEHLKGAPQAINNAFVTIGNVINFVKPAFSWMIQHSQLVKASLVGLSFGAGAVGVVSQALKIKNALDGAKKAAEGLSGMKKAGTFLSSLFKIPTGAIAFIAVVTIVAGLAYIIIKNWGPITTFFKNIWAGITGGVESLKNSLINNWTYIKNSVANIANGIGSGISNTWKSIKNGVSTACNNIKLVAINIWNNIKTATRAIAAPLVIGVLNIWNSMKAGIATIFTGVKNVIQGVWSVIKNIILGPVLLIIDLVKGNWTKLGKDAKAIFTNLGNSFRLIWTGIRQIFVGYLTAIAGVFKSVWGGLANIVKAIWNGIKIFFVGLWTGIKSTAISAWEGLKIGVITIVTNVWQGIINAFNAVVNFFKNLPGTLYNSGVAMFTSLKDGAWSIISGIGAWITEKFNAVLDFFVNLPSKTLEFGKNFIQGFIDGVEGMIDAVINKVKSVGESIEKKIREVLGIHSPSRVMHSIGQFTIQGLANGMDSSKKLLTNTAARLGQNIPKQFRGWGKDIPVSLADGITDNVKAATDTVTDMANGIRRIIHFTKPDEGPLKDSDTYGPDMVKGLSEGIQNNMPLTTNSTVLMATNIRNVMVQLIRDCVPYGQAIVNSLAQGVQDSMSNLTSIVQTLTDKVVTAFREGFGIHSPSKVMYEIGGYLMQGLVNGMSSKNAGQFITKWIGDVTGAVGGNISGWLSAALAITGTDQNWLQGLLKLASYESGDPGTLGTGNATLVNNISVGGEFATGLLQMLPSTFREFMQPGMSDITNPIHNAAAAINYIKSRYGSVYNTPLFRGGSYMGYASGTDNAKEGVADLAEDGMEIVLGRQTRRFKGGEQVLNNKDTVSLLKNRGNKVLNVYVIVKGNVIGNEEFKEELGEYVGKVVLENLDNM